MDQILEGTLRSDRPEAVKRELMRRVVQAGSQAQSADVVANMFQICTRIILESNIKFEIDTCKSVYHTWAKYNRASFQKFFSTTTLHYLLDTTVVNEEEAVWLIHTSLILLRAPGNPVFDHLCRIVEVKAISFVRQHLMFGTISSFCRFLLDFRECIPKGEHTSTFCVSLIHVIATFIAPKTAEGMRIFLRDVTHTVGGLLKHIWTNADRESIIKCLKAIFNIISLINEENLEPSMALGGIVQHIPVEYVDSVTRTTVSDHSIKDRNMSAALGRMIDWLSWPCAQYIDIWVVALLRGLAAVHKYTILIDVCETKIEQVYEKMHYKVVRHSALAVLAHMLLSFQHSPELFHKIIQHVPRTLAHWRHDSTEDSYRAQCHLAELMHCLMALHPGFPDLYEPIMDSIRDLPAPTATLR